MLWWNKEANATKDDQEEIQEVTARLAASEENSMDAYVAALSPDLDGILTLKKEQRTPFKAFLGEKDVFALLRTGSARV